MQFNPVYQLTLFRPRSEDPTETEPLTQRDDPSEQFVVSTAAVLGARAILARPRGRRGRLDLVRRRIDTGEITLRILDQRQSGDATSLHRWVTSFLGDAEGHPRFLRLRAQVLESLDGGATWNPFFTGRVWRPALSSKLWWEFIVRDAMEELEHDIFLGPPGIAATYALPSPLLPADGFPEKYSDFATVPWLRGGVSTPQFSLGGERTVGVDRKQDDGIRNARTRALEEAGWQGSGGRVRLRITKSTANPSRVGELGDYALQPVNIGGLFGTVSSVYSTERGVTAVGIASAPPTDPHYLELPASGDEVEWYLYRAGPPTPSAPLLISDVHPVTLLRHILEGHFGLLTDARTPRISMPYDAARFAALEADQSFGTRRYVITKTYTAGRFIEQLLQDIQLALRVGPDGRLVPIDLRLPASLSGIPVIGADDVSRETSGTLWEHDPASVVSRLVVRHYFDRQTKGKPEPGPKLGEEAFDVRPSRLEPEIGGAVEYLFPRYGDLGEGSIEIDAIGLRETARGGTDQLHGSEGVRHAIDQVATFYRMHFSRGLMTMSLPCRRTPAVESGYEGDLRILQVPWVPDPATNFRGGHRLVRIVERSPDGPRINLRVVDLGADVVALPPSVGALARSAEDPRHTITAQITLNAALDPVVIYAAVTDTEDLRPVEKDARWMVVDRRTQAGTLTISRLPSGSRIWIRIRSEGSQIGTPKLPSAWVYPAANYVDTEALPPPSAITATALTRSTAALQWALGDATLGIEVLLRLGGNPAAWTDDDVILNLSAGSIRYPLRGLDGPTVQHTAGIRHIDPYGGSSAVARVTFSTTTTVPQAPRPAGISLAGGA